MSKRDNKAITERAAMIAGVLYPITAIPQAVQIYTDKNAIGVSLLSWVGFFVLDLVFLAYGIVHKLKPLIVSGVLWFFLYILIISGIIIYG